MKKLFVLLFLSITFIGNAQITLENTYPLGGALKNYLQLVKLSSSGYKYVTKNTSNIMLYNLNHTVFRTITTPSLGSLSCPSCPLNIYYLSEDLFDTNPATLEYFIFFNDASGVTHGRVYDETGNILFSNDSIVIPGPGSASYGYENFISYTSSGVKMIIWKNTASGDGATVYSLPGNLPCHDCVNGVTSGIINPRGDEQDAKISNPYPNPSKEETRIEYKLPDGITIADLVFYNMNGQEVKRYKVTNVFQDILISTSELNTGTYYYLIQTSKGFEAGKKMVVIK